MYLQIHSQSSNEFDRLMGTRLNPSLWGGTAHQDRTSPVQACAFGVSGTCIHLGGSIIRNRVSFSTDKRAELELVYQFRLRFENYL